LISSFTSYFMFCFFIITISLMLLLLVMFGVLSLVATLPVCQKTLTVYGKPLFP